MTPSALIEAISSPVDDDNSSSGDTPVPQDPDEADGPPPPGIVYLHTAPYGHAASLDRPVDNTDGPDRRTPYRTDVLQRMLGGGPLPVDANGDVALSVSFAVGDSMAPFIPDGHPFFFVREPGFVHGARYALWLGTTQADVIKRVEVLGGGVVALKSDNPAVGTLHLTAGDEDGAWTDEAGRDYELEIRGRVVWPLDTPQAVVGPIADRLTELAHRAFRT